MTAIQDRVIKIRNYQKHILKSDVEDICRKCGSAGKTIEHIIGQCPALAESAYLGRHNQLAKMVHQQLALKYGLLATAPPYYKYNPEAVLETEVAVMYWDRLIITDRTVDFNRPDIVLINKQQRRGIIIDIAVPLTHNIQKTEREKITKYENLAIELK
ncbi:hypothetical protein K8353_40995, partial [Burkholderia contaminans]|nr:hypothetical protein [Burkholderia contaminans]